MLFEQRDVLLVNGLTRQLERRCEIRDIDELSGVGRRKAEKLGQRVEGAQASQISNVALELRLQVVAVPGTASRRRAPQEGGGISRRRRYGERDLGRAAR
ncbi:MAG: hypothetical protein U0610_26565 [bacterium]